MNEFDGHLSDNDELLVDKGVDIGVAIDTHGQMSLVEITPNLLAELLGDHAEAVSVRSGIGFWFSAAGTWATVNRMATLNLLAASAFPPRTVPLLWGPVLIAAAAIDGKPRGLTDTHIDVLSGGPELTWLEQRVLLLRLRRAERRRRGSTLHRPA
ncbi:hypothetical protein CKJ66_26340 [Mycobacterium avium]|uniref:DUF3846 domain-containing protein n=1 Tax=Mycobacterium avium TaxID=1764 RepID=A0A2A2ZBE2_MYCAV|nr:hypothetical protein [Mycobacterium avium]PBA23784.1 hypothetical protein CKJ66_26340 [Mycobacterium avium]